MGDYVLRFGQRIPIDQSKLPNHLAFVIGGNEQWARKQNAQFREAYGRSFDQILILHRMTMDLNIPICSFLVLREPMKDPAQFNDFIDCLQTFMQGLLDSPLVIQNKVKVSVLGKWYKLPDRVVDLFKQVIDKTRDCDQFFLNLCVLYDGQEEIVDACKLIGKQIAAGRLDPDLVTKEIVKENLYTSFFLPVSFIILPSSTKSIKGFLLWDISEAKFYFAKQGWLDFTENDLLEALGFHQGI